MPKLPPPPRRPHRSSGFSASLAVHEAPVGGDHVGPGEVVAGQSELAHGPADAAAEREPGHAGGRDEAARGGQAVGLGLVVDVGPNGAAADARAPCLGVDRHVAHGPEVDDDPAVDGREPGDAVAAAAHRDVEVVAAGEADGGDHVRRAGAPHDQRRAAPVVGAVPRVRGLDVARVRGGHHVAAHGLAQLLHRRFPEHGADGLGHLRLLWSEGRSGVNPAALSGRLAAASNRSLTSATPISSSRAA